MSITRERETTYILTTSNDKSQTLTNDHSKHSNTCFICFKYAIRVRMLSMVV